MQLTSKYSLEINSRNTHLILATNSVMYKDVAFGSLALTFDLLVRTGAVDSLLCILHITRVSSWTPFENIGVEMAVINSIKDYQK